MSEHLFDACCGGGVEACQQAAAVAVVTRDGDHGRVVGSEFQLGDEGAPVAAASRLGNGITQARIGRDASADGNVFYAESVGSLDELVEQDVDYGVLE